MNDTEQNEYLGDGVYASFDGYQIWLAANHHENKVVALEPAVMFRLEQYAIKMFGGAATMNRRTRIRWRNRLMEPFYILGAIFAAVPVLIYVNRIRDPWGAVLGMVAIVGATVLALQIFGEIWG